MSQEEWSQGGRLGIDSWADTGCSGRHAYVKKFVVGKTVSATGFSPFLGKLDNLCYAHVLYAYNHWDGTTLIIEHNNTISLGEDMEDSLCNPIQSEEAGTKVDIRSSLYYEDSDGLQSIMLPNGTIIPILYDGVLPYIPVRRPRQTEIDGCIRIQLTMSDD